MLIWKFSGLCAIKIDIWEYAWWLRFVRGG